MNGFDNNGDYTFLVSQEQRPPAPKKHRGRGLSAILLCACIMLSAVFGFAGAYIGNNISGDGAQTGDTVKEVLYQSVIRSVAASDTNEVEAMTVGEVAAAVKNSIVEITTESVVTNGRMGQLITTGAGSGVIISADGYIVTNNHVIEDARGIKVRLANGEEYKASLIGADKKGDLAIIKIEKNDLSPVVLGDSGLLTVGEQTVAVGNPLGELGGTVTQGIISALDREITIDSETMSLLQTDAAINPGNSGGGLFNMYGELIGIVNAKSSGSDIEGLGFAIPVTPAKQIIEDLIEYGYVKGRIDTGLTLVDIQNVQTAMMYRVSELGLYISESESENFEPGDRITAANGNDIANLSDYNNAVKDLTVGDTLNITVVRDGTEVTAQIILSEQN